MMVTALSTSKTKSDKRSTIRKNKEVNLVCDDCKNIITDDVVVDIGKQHICMECFNDR